MSNAALQVATSALLAAHFAVLVIALFASKSPVPMFVLNLCVATGVLIYLGFHPRFLAAPVDRQMVVLGMFEALVCAISVLAMRRAKVAIMLSYVIFSLHFLVAGAATAFAFLFRITRLF
jgi:hypothetical protein